jgi:mRNA interferase RelE/StbE
VYTVEVLRRAQGSIAGLPASVAVRARAAIAALSHDPRPPGCKKLKAETQLWRIRVGEYRVVYTINDTARVVTVVKVGHRREVYR